MLAVCLIGCEIHLLGMQPIVLTMSIRMCSIRIVDVMYDFSGCQFVWDGAKARANLSKHGVSFEQAVEAFFDPFLRVIDHDDSSNPDVRDALLGMTESWSLLFVVHIAAEHETYRVISARLATTAERKLYET